MSDAFPTPCPCGRMDTRGKPVGFDACCGRFLNQGQHASDAEQLMRSRYSAFVLGRTDYLNASWHPRTRPADLVLEPGVKWLGLEVRRHRVVDEDHAEGEFVARSRLGGRAQRLHETSRFVRVGGQWFYLDGDLK